MSDLFNFISYNQKIFIWIAGVSIILELLFWLITSFVVVRKKLKTTFKEFVVLSFFGYFYNKIYWYFFFFYLFFFSLFVFS